MSIAELSSAARAAEHGQRLNTTEAAQYTGLSASTLSKLRVFGGGPQFLKLSRRVVYDSRDLDAWLTTNSRRSTSDCGSIAA